MKTKLIYPLGLFLLILTNKSIGQTKGNTGNQNECNTPQYVTEINSCEEICRPNNQPDAGLGNPTGWAGLKFKDLTSDCIPQRNPNKAVLSVDECGNVIYVPDANGSNAGINSANNGLSLDPANSNIVQFGQDIGAPGNPASLLNDREIPMQNNNIYFNDDAVPTFGNNRLQLGSISNPWQSKFISSSTGPFTWRVGGIFTTDASIPAFPTIPFNMSPYYFGVSSLAYKFGAMTFAVEQQSLPGRCIGLSSFAYSNTVGCEGTWGISGKAFSNTSVINTGVLGLANGTSDYSYGGSFSGSGATFENYGTRTTAIGPLGSTNFGIYSSASGGSTNWAGWFDGDVNINGAAYCTISAWSSDERFKNTIKPLNDGISIIKQLKPKSYYFNTDNEYGINFPKEQQIGFIAQELEQVLPNLVLTNKKPEMKDSTGKVVSQKIDYKAINYIEIIPILVKATQEQQEMLEKQNATIEQLKNQINELLKDNTGNLGKNGQTEMHTEVNLSNNQTVVLEQNVPNPFAEHTVINYQVPESAKTAKLLFYDAKGKLIQSATLRTLEKGVVDVFASDLNSGVYTYTLVIDDKIIETKKMIKE